MESFMQDNFSDVERASSARRSSAQRLSMNERSGRKSKNSPMARSSTTTSGLAGLFTDEAICDAFEELEKRGLDTDITENEVDNVDGVEAMGSEEYSDRMDVDEEMKYEFAQTINVGDNTAQDDLMNSLVDEILETENENEIQSSTSGHGATRDDSSSYFAEEEDFQTTDDNEDDSIATRNGIQMEDNQDLEMEYDADRSGTSDESLFQDDSPLFGNFAHSQYENEYDVEEDPETFANRDYGNERSTSISSSIDEEKIRIEPQEHREFRRFVADDGPGIHESTFEHFRMKIASGILLKKFLRSKELRDEDDSCAVSENSVVSEDEDEVDDDYDDDYDDVEPPLDGRDVRLRRALGFAIESFEGLLPDDEDCLLPQKERNADLENAVFQRPTFPGLRKRKAREVEDVEYGGNVIEYNRKFGCKRILNSALVANREDLLEAGKAAIEHWRLRAEQWKDMVKIQEETIQPTTPEKKSSPLTSSTPRRTKRKRKELVIHIPPTSPIAKRFASECLRRKSQDFDIYEDSPSPLKGAEIFDLDAFDNYIEEARARLRFSICISSSKEERDKFHLYEGLGVQFVKFMKVKKETKDGEDKSFDVGILHGLLMDLLKMVEGGDDDEFVRFNFFNPLLRGIDRGVMLDGVGGVKLVFNGVREERG